MNAGFPGGSVVKDTLARQETWVQSLDPQGSLEEGMATHSSILAWRIAMDRGACWATVHGVRKELDKTECLNTAQHNKVPETGPYKQRKYISYGSGS